MKKRRVWRELDLEVNGLRTVQLHDSISEEELRRLRALHIVDVDGFIIDGDSMHLPHDKGYWDTYIRPSVRR